MKALRWLGAAMGGLGAYFGSLLSREYDGWSAFAYIFLAVISITVVGLFWQFLFFNLSPKRRTTQVFPWHNDVPPKVKLPHSPLGCATNEIKQCEAMDVNRPFSPQSPTTQ
jgi:hypothetical protein